MATTYTVIGSAGMTGKSSGDGKCVSPNVRIVEVCVWVRGDPGGDALGGLAGGLGDVAAGGVELAVFVWRVGVSVALLRRMVSS